MEPSAVAAFFGSMLGVIVTLGGLSVLSSILTTWGSRKQIEQLRVAIDRARKEGVPVSYEIKN